MTTTLSPTTRSLPDPSPTTTSAPPNPRTAVAVSVAGGAGFVALVALLHALKPGYNPNWRMISEYEIGRHGWVMRLAFFCLGTCCFAAVAALRSSVRTRGGGSGLVALVIAGIGLVMGGLFVADPINSTSDQLTTHGNLHGMSFFLGVPGILVAVTVLTVSLGRRPEWAAERRRLRLAAVGCWATLVVFLGVMAATFDGKFGPDVPVGWPNRLMTLTWVIWLIIAATGVRRLPADLTAGLPPRTEQGR